jgi:hypothetical protein
MNDNLSTKTFTINNNIARGAFFGTAMSYNGQYQLVGDESRGVFLSTNYGLNWSLVSDTSGDPIKGQSFVAISRSGQYQTIATGGKSIYISNNFGVTWVASSSPVKTWRSVAMSSTGRYQIASDTAVYISSDYGINWNIITATNYSNPTTVSISLTGKYQSAAVNNVGILTSSDYGATWNLKTNITSNNTWFAIAMSSSGQHQTATKITSASNTDVLYVSNDYGKTWVNKMSLVGVVLCVAISGTGKYQLIANQITGAIYVSIDYGNTWAINAPGTGAFIQRFGSIAISKDGKYITLAAYQGNIFQCFNDINYSGSPELVYSTNSNGTAELIQYIGIESSVTIPDSIIDSVNNNSYIVTTIYDDTFSDSTQLTTVIIPSSITSINQNAFKCANLINVYFLGDTIPTISQGNFPNLSDTVYYKDGANNSPELSGLFNTQVVAKRNPASNVLATYSGTSILVSWTAPVVTTGILTYYNLTKYIVTPYLNDSRLSDIVITVVNNLLSTSTTISNIDRAGYYKFKVTCVYETVNSLQVESNNLVPYIIHCFNKGTKILTDTGYKNIETLKKGDLVKTHKNGFRHITYIYKSTVDYKSINSDMSKIYKCSKENYPELFEDLLITGYHGILVDELSEENKEKTILSGNNVYKVEDKWALLASLDNRATPHDEYGIYTVYHVAVSKSRKHKFGIYSNGLLTEAYF